jgi:DNA-directed RNA polymerase subunit F
LVRKGRRKVNRHWGCLDRMATQISEIRRIMKEIASLKNKIIRSNGSNSALSYLNKAEDCLEDAIHEISGFSRPNWGWGL